MERFKPYDSEEIARLLKLIEPDLDGKERRYDVSYNCPVCNPNGITTGLVHLSLNGKDGFPDKMCSKHENIVTKITEVRVLDRFNG